MQAPPLGELCDLLRDARFAIGVDHHVRIGRLLAYDAAWTPELLRTAIAALVVTEPNQQAGFDACWERWLRTAEPSQPAEVVLPDAPVPQRRSVRWAILIAAIATVVAVVLQARQCTNPRPTPEDARRAPEDAGVLPESLASTGPGQVGPLDGGGVAADAGVMPADAGVMPADAGVMPADAGVMPADAGVMPADGGVMPADAGVVAGPGPVVPPDDGSLAVDGGSVPIDGGPPPPRPPSLPPPSMIISLVALALGSTLLAVAAIAAVLGARTRRLFLPGPWRYALTVPRPTRPVLPRVAVEYAAADLSWLGSESEGDIDLPRSVAATVANGGLATLVHRRGPAPPQYLVFEDTAGGSERWRFLYDEILQGLAGEGVEVERYTFAGNLDRCTAPDGRSVAFGALLDRTEALIAIGDGDAAVNALTGERAAWLVALQHVPRRLWINPFPPARWRAGAHAIAADTPMEHGVARAVVAVRVGVDRPVRPDHAYPAVIERTPGTASAVDAMRDALGPRAFRLIAAVSVVGPPTVALARWVVENYAEEYKLEVRERDWLCIVTLPWFRTAQWPAGMRERLHATLHGSEPAFVNALTASSDDLLAKSKPPAGSAAHLAWRLDRAYRDGLRGNRRGAAHALNQITATPLAHQARGLLAALGLRDRARIALALSIVVGSALVSTSAGYLTATRQRSAVRPPVDPPLTDTRLRPDSSPRPPAVRHLEKLAGDGAKLRAPTTQPWPEVFAVRVVDGNGKPVPEARVVWSDPQLGRRSYIGSTDRAGISRAPQIESSPPRDDLEQWAQLITTGDSERSTDEPVPADGEKVVFYFAQIRDTEPPEPSYPCAEYVERKDWAQLKRCADAANAKPLRDKADREMANLAQAGNVTQAIQAGNLKLAQAALRRITSDSVYLKDARAAFATAESKEVERVKLPAQQYADSHDCASLQAYLDRITPEATERVAAALRVVRCVAPPSSPCSTLVVNDVKQQALALYNAGSARRALSEVANAIKCNKTDATLYYLATMYACNAHDPAAARLYFVGVAASSRTRVLNKCLQDKVDPRDPPCDSFDVDEVMGRAAIQYRSNSFQQALKLAVQALGCRQNVSMYRAAAMYACAARDFVRAKQYFAEVPDRQRQSSIKQRCLQEGLQL